MWPGNWSGRERLLACMLVINNYFCHRDGGWVNELLRVILRATCGSPLPEKEIPRTVREYRSDDRYFPKPQYRGTAPSISAYALLCRGLNSFLRNPHSRR